MFVMCGWGGAALLGDPDPGQSAIPPARSASGLRFAAGGFGKGTLDGGQALALS